MDRRNFLKLMGLSGTALLAPKPLEVIAARMADLSGPPLHVGVARFRDLNHFPFILQDAGIVLDGWQRRDAMTPQHMDDLLNNWTIHLAIRQHCGSYLKVSQRPLNRCLFGFGRDQFAGPNIILTPADSVEVWIVPEGQPCFPLPALTACIYGPPTFSIREPRKTASMPIRAVRLERSRAIELGLASTSDPFELI
jgi:hypothetical protein